MLNRKQLKQLRLKMGLLQTDVATAYGCTKQYISMLENGIQGIGTEESYKKYVNAIYKAYTLKQNGTLEKYDEKYQEKFLAKQKEKRQKQKGEKK